MIDFEALKAPFPPDRISWRVGSTNRDKTKGMALAYIDARDVMERLDTVCGPAGWQDKYPHANGKTVCAIGVKVDDEWIWKEDGAGDTDFEASKGALSDAFKRAAVRWGIGRYLYDLSAPWVEIEPIGKSFKIRDSEIPKLMRLLPGGAPKPVPDIPGAKKRPSDTWHGPLKITELKDKMRALKGELEAASDADSLNIVLQQYQAVLEQCEVDLPDWYFGRGDAKGAQERIAERTYELNKTHQTLSVA